MPAGLDRGRIKRALRRTCGPCRIHALLADIINDCLDTIEREAAGIAFDYGAANPEPWRILGGRAINRAGQWHKGTIGVSHAPMKTKTTHRKSK